MLRFLTREEAAANGKEFSTSAGCHSAGQDWQPQLVLHCLRNKTAEQLFSAYARGTFRWGIDKCCRISGSELSFSYPLNKQHKKIISLKDPYSCKEFFCTAILDDLPYFYMCLLPKWLYFKLFSLINNYVYFSKGNVDFFLPDFITKQ